ELLGQCVDGGVVHPDAAVARERRMDPRRERMRDGVAEQRVAGNGVGTVAHGGPPCTTGRSSLLRESVGGVAPTYAPGRLSIVAGRPHAAGASADVGGVAPTYGFRSVLPL